MADEKARQLLHQRATARQAKDYAAADALRERLRAMGFIVEDRGDGTTLLRDAAPDEPAPSPAPAKRAPAPDAGRDDGGSTKRPKRNARRNTRKRARRHRATLFVAWLVERFGLPALWQSGCDAGECVGTCLAKSEIR